jgi:hypothetical protein
MPINEKIGHNQETLNMGSIDLYMFKKVQIDEEGFNL